jgi:hypothetical protein
MLTRWVIASVVLAVFLALVGFVGIREYQRHSGCDSCPPDEQPTAYGEIVRMNWVPMRRRSSSLVKLILVKGPWDERCGTWFPTNTAEILSRQGDGYSMTTAADLRVGSQVVVWADSAIDLSFPAAAGAGTIVVG